MSRLLAANFARLWKSRAFHVLEAFVAGYSLMIYGDAYFTIFYDHKKYDNWNLCFFNDMMFIGVAMAVFVSAYIGVEYSNGTIRNKVSAGHSRLRIYLADLAVCYAAGVIACMTYTAVSLIMGLGLIGQETVSGIWKPGQGAVMALVILFAYTAIYVLISMVDMNTVRAAVVSLLLSIVLLGAGLVVCQYLEMPEYTVRLTEVENEAGEMQILEEPVYNSRYLRGNRRKVYEFAELLLPSAQVIKIVDRGNDYSVKQSAGLFGVAVLCSVAGIWVFRRKDIK